VETIECVSEVIAGAGVKPDPAPPASPATDEPPDVAMRTALEAFIRTIEATCGCIRPGRRTIDLADQEIVEFESDLPVPAGDEDWPDLADCYLMACRALGREPVIRDADEEDDPSAGE
jgi:hypothetical protein